jgi:murein DD-endopeptidase MepM/ murein hydrolase activator NlpD
LATLHHESQSHRTLQHPTTSVQPRRLRRRRAVVVAAVMAGVLLGAPIAAAAPGDGVSTAQAQHDAAAAEVAAIGSRVAEAEEALERMSAEAEAAGGHALETQAALKAAQAEASTAAAQLAQARAAVDRAQGEVSTIGREAYMGGDDRFGDVGLLLDADSPTELLEQAATLQTLGEQRTEQLQQFEAVEAEEARADAAARAAVAERDALARKAAEAKAAADAQLAAAQGRFDQVAAEKARLDAQLKRAEIHLLTLQGAQNAADDWAAAQAAEQAPTTLSVAGGAVAPATGRVTSCYGPRWGTMHSGIDIAAPIGTPIYAPEGGVVVQAGPASGFGLAVAVQHGDGTITLYGHVNQFFVSVGQAVSAGQQIAEVGNRGQSTGPHLHFEVHTGGLYVSRDNPVPWLTARGISLGGGC